MSFAAEVKAEIAQNQLHECCTRAQLAAFIQLNATVSIANGSINLVVQIENATIAKRIYSLLRSRYPHLDIELAVLKKQNLRKNNIYILRIMKQGKMILEDLGIMGAQGLRKLPYTSITLKECCARAYIAGAFMAAGSINAPTTANYHLEIACNSEAFANNLIKLLARFNLSAKWTMRRNNMVVYLKAGDQIADFLRIVGANVSTLNFEDIRIQRDFRNSLTRLDNCEVANEMKTISAGKNQLKAITKLEERGRLEELEPKLYEVALLRKDNPEANLNELRSIYELQNGRSISKSGMQHRFVKIIELASKIKGD